MKYDYIHSSIYCGQFSFLGLTSTLVIITVCYNPPYLVNSVVIRD